MKKLTIIFGDPNDKKGIADEIFSALDIKTIRKDGFKRSGLNRELFVEILFCYGPKRDAAWYSADKYFKRKWKIVIPHLRMKYAEK